MKKQITILALLFSSIGVFAQTTVDQLDYELNSLSEKVKILQLENRNLKGEIGNLKTQFSSSQKIIDSLKIQTEKNNNALLQTASQLGIKIRQTETTTKDGISKLDKDVEKGKARGWFTCWCSWEPWRGVRSRTSMWPTGSTLPLSLPSPCCISSTTSPFR